MFQLHANRKFVSPFCVPFFFSLSFLFCWCLTFFCETFPLLTGTMRLALSRRVPNKKKKKKKDEARNECKTKTDQDTKNVGNDSKFSFADLVYVAKSTSSRLRERRNATSRR
ncbi:hypothetical protein BGZ63DRAFT_55665 [Mariannaea sp. PMI_226]|nr:hypothetical protein BGZ63DRAFT_55665 [Mariannaea sp. PMI_226]